MNYSKYVSNNFRLFLIRQTRNYKAVENNINGVVVPKMNISSLSSVSKKEKKKEALLLNDLGHKKYMQVDFDEAIKDFSKAIELDNSFAIAYYNRGTIHYRMGCFEMAFKDFQKAVQLETANEEFKSGLKACEKRLQSTKERIL